MTFRLSEGIHSGPTNYLVLEDIRPYGKKLTQKAIFVKLNV